MLPSLAVALAIPIALAAEPPPRAAVRPDTDPDGSLPPADGGEEVVVEGRGAGVPDPATTSASVTVLAVDETVAATADVASLLERAAGTTVVQLGGLGDFSAVSIRGSSLRQVAVYLDGVPLNPDGSDVVDLSELPLQAFDQVRVWRSNAPLGYAASPIGGVVDLRTADHPTGSAAVTWGQYDTGRLFVADGFEAETGTRPADGLVVADLFHTRGDFSYFDDNNTIYNLLDDRRRTRDNNDKTQLSTLARLRWGDRRLRLTLQDGFLSRDEGLPGPIGNPTTAVRLETLRNLALGRVEAGGDSLRSDSRLWWLQRQESFDDRLGEIGTGNQWQRTWLTNLGLQEQLLWVPDPRLTTTGLLSIRRDSVVLADLLQDRVEPPRIRWSGTAAVGADLRLWSDRITLSPVLQAQGLDNRALGSLPFEDTAVAPEARSADLYFTPRLGLLLRPHPRVSLKANVGRGVRPPDLSELFGDRGAVIGNSELLPERSLSWDVGGRLSLPDGPRVRASLDLAHFWSRTEDLIVMVQNSQRTSVPINLGLAWVQGLEAAVNGELLDVIDHTSSLTWTLSRNLTPDPGVADNQLPRIPALEVQVDTGLHWGERLRLGHSWSYTAGNYWDATNFYLSAPRSIHGAFLRVQPDDRFPSVELSALNLTDRTVEIVPRNPLDETDDSRIVQSISDYVGYPLPGRTLLCTVRWSGW
ncbi:MAG: TonB-dependent receptor [Deltaproteobacteria bacterium]|nr:MAG: TonB-dependent receptor [Deltaproteobacteria bacterium]